MVQENFLERALTGQQHGLSLVTFSGSLRPIISSILSCRLHSSHVKSQVLILTESDRHHFPSKIINQPNLDVILLHEKINSRIPLEAFFSEQLSDSHVIIESLTPILYLGDLKTGALISLLIKMASRNKSLLVVLNSSAHSGSLCQSFRSVANCLVDITYIPKTDTYSAEVLSEKRHERMDYTVKLNKYRFRINPSDGNIQIIDKVEDNVKEEKSTSGAELDPIKNLPFKLTLNENEIDSREKVALPYHAANPSVQTAVQTGPKIFYTPDKADDIDEDDPDDDLDI